VAISGENEAHRDHGSASRSPRSLRVEAMLAVAHLASAAAYVVVATL
jgi:hypothetical protein